MVLRGPINVLVLQKYACTLGLRRRTDFLMHKELKDLDVHKCFEQLKKEGSCVKPAGLYSVIVNLNNVCYLRFERHLLKLMLSEWR
jgi:hypothetical protein